MLEDEVETRVPVFSARVELEGNSLVTEILVVTFASVIHGDCHVVENFGLCNGNTVRQERLFELLWRGNGDTLNHPCYLLNNIKSQLTLLS